MNQLKKFLNNLKYLLPAFGKYKKYSFIAIFSTFFETVMEVLVPIFMAKVLDDGILKQNMSLTLTYGIIMVIISLLAMASGLMATRYTGISSVGFGYNLRNLQYAKIQTFGFEDIEKFSTPSLITRMTGDIQQIIMSCFMIMRFLVKSPIMIIVTVIITINVNASLSMVFFATAPILALYVIFIAIKTIPGFTMFRSQFDNINLTVEENLANIRLIKSLVRQKKETNKFKEESKKMFNVGNIVFGRLSSLNAFSSFVLFLTTVLILLFGGNEIIKGRMGVGELTGFITYSMMLLMSLIMMSNLLVQIIASSASITRVSEVLKHETKLKDDKASDENKVIDGSVDFENVFFKYEEDSKNYALSGVNLHIKSGEKIGILGETGSSKSTLVQLIPRLYDVSEGKIKVSGVDVRDYKFKNLRDNVAVVLQKNVLFSGTIKENMRMGNLNATEEEIINACKIAQAHDFIMERSDGYNSILGQGGSGVSGGQKQRLCIARALLKKPKILILDNSTSAVDTATDKKIRDGLEKFSKDMTTITISQRINSIMNCDRIIIMENGRIEDIGDHEYLMKNNENYKKLYELQQKGEDDE